MKLEIQVLPCDGHTNVAGLSQVIMATVKLWKMWCFHLETHVLLNCYINIHDIGGKAAIYNRLLVFVVIENICIISYIWPMRL